MCCRVSGPVLQAYADCCVNIHCCSLIVSVTLSSAPEMLLGCLTMILNIFQPILFVYFHYCHLFFLVYLSKNLVLTGIKTFFCSTTSAYFLFCWCQVFSSLCPSLSSNGLSSIHILLVSLYYSYTSAE